MQLFAIVDYALYCQRICQDICESTGWKVFKIKPVSQPVASLGMGKGATTKWEITVSQQIEISEKFVKYETVRSKHASINKQFHPNLSQNPQAPNGQGKH